MPGFQESSDQSALGVAVTGLDKISVVMSPMVEIGGRCNVSQMMVLRPYVAVGMSFLPDNTSTVNASFTGALASFSSFAASSKSPSILGNVVFGVQLYQIGGVEVGAEYEGNAGDAYLSQSWIRSPAPGRPKAASAQVGAA
jgi:hypothetical protein